METKYTMQDMLDRGACWSRPEFKAFLLENAPEHHIGGPDFDAAFTLPQLIHSPRTSHWDKIWLCREFLSDDLWRKLAHCILDAAGEFDRSGTLSYDSDDYFNADGKDLLNRRPFAALQISKFREFTLSSIILQFIEAHQFEENIAPAPYTF